MWMRVARLPIDAAAVWSYVTIHLDASHIPHLLPPSVHAAARTTSGRSLAPGQALLDGA